MPSASTPAAQQYEVNSNFDAVPLCRNHTLCRIGKLATTYNVIAQLANLLGTANTHLCDW